MRRHLQCIKKGEVNPKIWLDRTVKKVQFSDKITIYEFGNSEEHRSARNGLQDLRDRERFMLRVQRTGVILEEILINKLKKINL